MPMCMYASQRYATRERCQGWPNRNTRISMKGVTVVATAWVAERVEADRVGSPAVAAGIEAVLGAVWATAVVDETEAAAGFPWLSIPRIRGRRRTSCI